MDQHHEKYASNFSEYHYVETEDLETHFDMDKRFAEFPDDDRIGTLERAKTFNDTLEGVAVTDENLKGVDGIDCANDEEHDLEFLGVLVTSYLDPF